MSKFCKNRGNVVIFFHILQQEHRGHVSSPQRINDITEHFRQKAKNKVGVAEKNRTTGYYYYYILSYIFSQGFKKWFSGPDGLT